MKIGIIIGTRPEIIKMSPIIKQLYQSPHESFLIHSGQHYSYSLDRIFFEEFGLLPPDYTLDIGSGSHGNQTGNIMIKMEPIMMQEEPDIVLVQGDTNTVLAAALAATKLGIPVGHVEAGLRSYDRKMPEETNRIVTDHVSDFLFAVSEVQQEILVSEGVDPKKIYVVGNTIVDTTLATAAACRDKDARLTPYGLQPNKYLLATIHRSANVDDIHALEEVMSTLSRACEFTGHPMIWPVHPRTKKQLEQYAIGFSKKIQLIDPVGYSDFICLQQQAKIVFTDSGGVQEECCILGTPCITLRENTERPETVSVGANELVGRDQELCVEAIRRIYDRPGEHQWSNPFGDGKTGQRILEIISQSDLARSKLVADNQVCVVGMGYMGLPFASLMAASGYRVHGCDIAEPKIQQLQSGELPFVEAGLPELFQQAQERQPMSFGTNPVIADYFIVAVPTNKHGTAFDGRHLWAACESIIPYLTDGATVIIESTIKPGTIEAIYTSLFEPLPMNIHLAYCPERAIPGRTITELTTNDRIVGGLNQGATTHVVNFYESFLKAPIHATTAATAECVKLLENTYRDVNIALANEFSCLLEGHGVNVTEAIGLANKHPRVNILSPGPGVGGHCISIDPWFLVEDQEAGELVRQARNANDERPVWLINKLIHQHKLSPCKVGILGIAYKPDVDDARETPAHPVLETLEQAGYQVAVSDPCVTSWHRSIISEAELFQWADIAIMITQHSQYQDIAHRQPENMVIYNLTTGQPLGPAGPQVGDLF